jgi:hypothetical protein
MTFTTAAELRAIPLKDDFGVRRLVAAFALGHQPLQKLVANLTRCQSGDESPHSKIIAITEEDGRARQSWRRLLANRYL